MKKMKLVKWKITDLDGKATGKEESIIDVIIAVMSRASQSMGSGIEQFRFIHRVSEAFDIAEKNGELQFEDSDYNKLVDMVKNNLPSGLGFKLEIYNAVEDFLKL